MDERDWVLRNSSRDAIADMFRVIRRLQVINGFKHSEIIQIMFNVWRSQNDVFLVNHLMVLMRDLRRLKKRR